MKTWLRCSVTWAVLLGSLAGAGMRSNSSNSSNPLSEEEERALEAQRAAVQEFRERDDALCREIVMLHDKIQVALNEMEALKLAGRGGSKKALKARQILEAREADTKRDRRRMENLAKKHLRPYQKVYDQNRTRYDVNLKKAFYYERKGESIQAQAYRDEAARYMPKMEPVKREIDTVQWFLSFDHPPEGERDQAPRQYRNERGSR